MTRWARIMFGTCREQCPDAWCASTMRERVTRAISAAFALSVVVCAPIRAQTTLPRLEDATTPPRGALRFRVISAWERYDSHFTSGGTLPLGVAFTADSFGVANIPALAPIQSAIASAAASPFTLNFGRARLNATTRINIVPIVFEYGVTSRLSVGAFIPIVRQRLAAAFLLAPFRFDPRACFRNPAPAGNPCQVGANVGPNPNRTNPNAAQQNAQLQLQFATAEAQLQSRIQSCQANPSAAGCDVVLAQGQQLLQSSQVFADTVGALYGTSTDSGMAFVPLSLSDAQVQIAGRVAVFNAEYRALLGSDVITSVPAGAGPAGSADIQQYLAHDLQRDTVASRDLLAY